MLRDDEIVHEAIVFCIIFYVLHGGYPPPLSPDRLCSFKRAARFCVKDCPKSFEIRDSTPYHSLKQLTNPLQSISV